MGTIVRDVYDAVNSQVATTLGASFTELRFLFDIEQNTSREITKGYAVIPQEATNVDTVLRSVTSDHTFEIILTDRNVREIDDSDKITTILDTLYNNMDEIRADLVNQQLGLPTTILTIMFGSISAPEFLDSYIVLRMQMIIKYRRLL